MSEWRSTGIAAVAALTIASAGCASERPADARPSGTVVVDGSSTVYPVTEAVAEELTREHGRAVRVMVGISGTGGGFKRFCIGETDLSNASRAISASERELCAKNGVEFLELPVAFDGLTVAVNRANDLAMCPADGALRGIRGERGSRPVALAHGQGDHGGYGPAAGPGERIVGRARSVAREAVFGVEGRSIKHHAEE